VPAILVIGCTAHDHRGLDAVVAELAVTFPAPTVVVAHQDARGEPLATTLAHVGWPLVEVRDKDSIEPGAVYVVPPDYHLLVDGEAFALSTEDAIHGARPAVDPLFESAADAYAERAIAVLITDGTPTASADGMRGLARIRERGGVGLLRSLVSPMRSQGGPP
jgi:two-component system chemotaxis response regulator CheB